MERDKPTKQEALKKLQHLCAKKECCSSDMFKKLTTWHFSSEEADEIVEALIEEKFIDNLRYASAFTRDKFKLKQWGKIKIRYLLNAKSIDSTIIEKALSEISDEAYQATLKIVYNKKEKHYSKKHDGLILQQKITDALLRQGFEIEEILTCQKAMIDSNTK